MNVPLLDLQPQMSRFRDQVLEAVTSVIDSTRYILGSEVSRFEKEVAAYCGTGFGIGVSSGTDALLASLMALEIGAGDLVLTTPYTFFATMGSILRVGARPVFADIDPDTMNIDPAQVERILADDQAGRKKIRAIMPVHLFGQCADMQPLLELAARYGIPIIEDAAQAIGAQYPLEENGAVTWKKAGAMGTAGCFSFFPSKNLGGIGDGGMVVTSDSGLDRILRSCRDHGADPKYYHRRIGGNFRLDPIQAVVLSIKLPHLEEWHRARRRNATLYREYFSQAGLTDNPVVLPREAYGGLEGAAEVNYHIYNQFVIRVPDRDRLRSFLQENSIGCEIYYPLCLHQQACLAPLGYGDQTFPVAEEAARQALALPIYPELQQEQIAYVVEKISEFF
ncbi:MAG TPA: DegT/DnrJ/EryC1/StrS family aminotransferase [Desulfobulbus sp.]|nr:DegT/DnrJ/EryC1/StrS family aminotransferase [Desulfobulbus sp.]